MPVGRNVRRRHESEDDDKLPTRVVREQMEMVQVIPENGDLEEQMVRCRTKVPEDAESEEQLDIVRRAHSQGPRCRRDYEDN